MLVASEDEDDDDDDGPMLLAPKTRPKPAAPPAVVLLETGLARSDEEGRAFGEVLDVVDAPMEEADGAGGTAKRLNLDRDSADVDAGMASTASRSESVELLFAPLRGCANMSMMIPGSGYTYGSTGCPARGGLSLQGFQS